MRWFGYVMRRDDSEIVKDIMKMSDEYNCKMERGRD